MRAPADRTRHRQALLSAAEAVRETIEQGAAEGEAERTLPKSTLEALREHKLVGFKVPEALGGLEADPLTQVELLESASSYDGASGWCLAIQGGISGIMSAFLPDEAALEIFAQGIPYVAGALAMSGKAAAVEGGFRVTGRWQFGSGIRHAKWVIMGVGIIGSDDPGSARLAVAPASQVKIHDNWHVAGLRGTGSCDFSVEDLFVPEHRSFRVLDFATGRARRGGALYRMGMPGFLAMEHAAIALGIGRRALDEVTRQATSKLRGGIAPGTIASPLAHRAAFQNDLGRAEVRLRAARALVFDVFDQAWNTAVSGRVPPPEEQAEMRSVAREATEVSAEVTCMAYRYAGGGVLFESNPIQRCFRDINAASQHFVVSDTAFEALGQFRLGLADANAMG